MKKNRSNIFASAFFCVASLVACKKNDVPAPTDFSVSANQLTYKVGDTAQFTFSGRADQVVFFSGEPGKAYANIGRTQLAGIPKLVFQCNMQQGSLDNNDSLRLYVATNLKGYDAAAVAAANWVEITDRNTNWPAALGATFVTSDSISLADFNNFDSVNIAFRATGNQYPTSAQRKWQVQNLTLTNYLPDGSATPLFSTFANTGWVQANVANNPAPSLTVKNYQAWNVGEAGVSAANSTLVIGGKACNSNGIAIQTAYPITFDPSNTTNVEANDDWLITSAVNLKNAKPAVGTVIKNTVALNITNYSYVLTTPGTFLMTFIAQNMKSNAQKQVVKQIEITVTP